MVNALAAASAAEFHSPGPADFEFPPIFTVAGLEFTKPMLIIVLSAVVVAAFFLAAAAGAKLVPGKLQYAGEAVYGFVRNSIAIDSIGHEGVKWAGYLTTLFGFLVVMNLSGIVPFLNFPATSRIAVPLGLAALSWIIFNYLGIRRQGFVGYFKNMMFPPGIPKAVYIILAPIEFVSTVIIRPITLTLRLTFNMFAGHLVLLLFILGGEYLLLHFTGNSAIGIAAGSMSIVLGFVMTFFEGFVQILQAYVFVLLTAMYIGGALVDEH